MNNEDYKHIKEWNTEGPLLRERAIGGSKGCFSAGTLVSTPYGSTKIEELSVGDEVFCFSVEGTIHTSTVASTHKHEDHSVVRIKHWLGVIYTTFNHWFLREDNTFQRVGDLTKEDALVSDSGTLLPIEDIAEVSTSSTVYNITVKEFKTFIANGIRVHNGGDSGEAYQLASNNIPVMGGKGGGKGGGAGQPAKEDPDSLFSKANARVLDLICEGEIEGLVDGAKSIYLNETALQNSDNSYNFEDVSWEQRTGQQSQTYVGGFTSVESGVAVGTQLKKGAPGPIVRSINNPNLDAVSVTLYTPSLTVQNKETGDMHGSSVSYKVYIKYDSGSFVERVKSTMEGKTTKKYERQHRINLSGSFTVVTIKVERITDDAADLSTQNSLYWQSYTQIIDNKFTYPNSALVGLQIDAKQFSRIPNRAYDIKGLKVRVPTNYNNTDSLETGVTNLYSGAWDGTFKTAWTNNPAWCYYDILTDERYGLGAYIPETHIDKWALYQIARYCDAVDASGTFLGVDDGFGAKEKRFALNLYIQTQNEALKIITDMASVFRGMTYWGQGMLTAVQDSPKDPIMLFSEANVIGGDFTYSGTAKKARHTTALVTWNNPEDFYRRNIEYVEDRSGITKWGVRQTDVIAFGCTSRAQAHRIGKWILYSERLETDTISFKTGLDGASLRPGDLVKIADPARAGKRMGGRVSASNASGTTSNTLVCLDYPLSTDTTNSYTLSIMRTSPTCILNSEVSSAYTTQEDCVNASGQWQDYTSVETKDVTNILDSTNVLAIEVSSAFSVVPTTQHLWVLDEIGITETQDFRVLAIAESHKNEYTVTALEYNGSKYNYIESGVSLQDKTINSLPSPSDSVPSINNLDIQEELYLNPNKSVNNRMVVSWDYPIYNGSSRYPYEKNYVIEYKNATSNWLSAGSTQSSYVEIDSTPAGTYSVRVKVENTLGKFSSWVTLQKTLNGKQTLPSDVTGLNLVGVGNNAIITWDRPTSNSDLDVINGGYYRIRYNNAIVNPIWAGSTDIGGKIGGSSSSTTVPLLAGSYLIKAYDSSGNESVNAVAAKSNVATMMSLNAVHSSVEDIQFLGGHSDTTVQNGTLRLAEIIDADYSFILENTSGIHDFDEPGVDLQNESITAIDSYDYGVVGHGDRLVKTLGYYNFSTNPVDLGQVFTSRVTSDLAVYTTEVGTTFDIASGLFDSNSGKFDGGDVSDADVQLQVSTTSDDPSIPNPLWDSWTPFNIGDYSARAYKFRLKLFTADPNHNIVVTKLRTTIDMPDRTARAYNISTVSGIKDVVFDQDFKTGPSVGLTVSDLSTGDYWNLTNQNNSGFSVAIYNSLNQLYGTDGRPEKNFNYIAVGY